MLILAATTISVLFGENGIITKTKQAKSEYERAGQNEQLGLKELQNRLNEIHTGGSGGGNTAENESGGGEVEPTPDMGDIQIQYAPTTPRNTSKGSAINGVERGPIQVSIQYGNTSFINHNRYQYKIGEGEWVAGAQTYQFEVNHNTTIYARYFDGVTGYKQTSQAISNVDNEGPAAFIPTLENKTTKSITIKGETNDPSGIKGYRFSKDDGSTWTEEQTGTSYTFQDLATSTYQIKIKAIDKAGNETTSQALEVATQSIPEATGNISRTEVWENGKLKISLATNQASYPIQYKIGNGIWTEYSNPVELNLNQTLHYRLTDGQNAGAEASQTAQDTTKPTNPDLAILEGTVGQNNWYTSNVTIQITQGTDSQSGIAKTTYTLTGAQTQAETEIANKGTIQITKDGTTTITAYNYDKAGNKSPAGTITLKKDTSLIAVTVTPETTTQAIEPGQTTTTVEITIQAQGSISPITKTEYNFTESNTVAPTNWKTYTNQTKLTENLEGGTYYLWTKTTKETGQEEIKQIGNTYTVNYKIQYNLNGGTTQTQIADQIKTKNTNITLTNTTPSKTGYQFLGWNENQTATTATYPAQGSYQQNKATILYAIWRKTITISYNANGGTGAPSTQTGNVFNNTTSMNFTIPSTVPTKAGYTFLGWSTSNTATTATYVAGNSYSFTDSTTLYAAWEKIIEVDENGYATSNAQISKGSTQIVVPKGMAIANLDSNKVVTGVKAAGEWNKITEEEINKGIVVIDSLGNEFVWVPVASGEFKRQAWDSSEVTIEPTTNSASGYWEEKDEGMYTSVETYKGFYIGRYEASEENGISISKRNLEPIVNIKLTMAEENVAKTYDSITDVNKKPTVVPHIMYSVEWDTLLTWIGKSDPNYLTDSSGKGNYSGTIINSGSNSNYEVNNIYDLAGNCSEWTKERYGSNTARVITIKNNIHRGGSYSTDTSLQKPIIREIAYNRGSTGPALANVTYRIFLYLQ